MHYLCITPRFSAIDRGYEKRLPFSAGLSVQDRMFVLSVREANVVNMHGK
jgi:hypothetical protein